MDFSSRTLVRLLDEDELATVLTNDAGDLILGAALRPDAVGLGDVAQVTPLAVELSPSVLSHSRSDVDLHEGSGTSRWTGAVTRRASGAPIAAARIDARLTVAVSRVDTTVLDVVTDQLSDLADEVAIDARVVADGGALDIEPAQLEDLRFAALKAMITDRSEVPADFDADSFTSRAGVATTTQLRELLEGPLGTTRLKLSLQIDPLAESVENIDLTFFVFVEADPYSALPDLLTRVGQLRSSVEATRSPVSAPSGMSARTPATVLVLHETAALNDVGLPPDGVAGANAAARTERLTELNNRFKATGIAFLPIAT